MGSSLPLVVSTAFGILLTILSVVVGINELLKFIRYKDVAIGIFPAIILEVVAYSISSNANNEEGISIANLLANIGYLLSIPFFLLTLYHAYKAVRGKGSIRIQGWVWGSVLLIIGSVFYVAPILAPPGWSDGVLFYLPLLPPTLFVIFGPQLQRLKTTM